MPDKIPFKQSNYDNTTDRKENDRFYTGKVWRNCRQAFLNIPGNRLCHDCLLKTPPAYTATEEVHHIKDRRQYPDLALDFDNMMPLCKSCHSRRTMTEMNRYKDYT